VYRQLAGAKSNLRVSCFTVIYLPGGEVNHPWVVAVCLAVAFLLSLARAVTLFSVILPGCPQNLLLDLDVKQLWLSESGSRVKPSTHLCPCRPDFRIWLFDTVYLKLWTSTGRVALLTF